MGAGFSMASYFNDLSTVEYTEEQKAAVEMEIASNPVMIYSKDYCPYCIKAKNLLDANKVAYKVREINKEEDCLTTHAIIFKISSHKTVPNIFIDGKPIGGNSELQALAKSGELKSKLDAARVANAF